MDPNELELEAAPSDFAALSQRVADLERMVAELQGKRQPQMSRRELFQSAPPPPMPLPLIPDRDPERLVAAPAVSSAPPKSFEDRLGSQIFPLIGVFAIICGATYFLKLAIDHGWVNPTSRVILGLFAGAGVIVGSEYFRRKKLAAFAYTLKGLGTTLLYLSLWYGFQRAHLLPAWAALAAMVLVTAWNAWMALTQDAELLAGYALAGGLLTPALLSSGQNSETFLFTYLSVIAFGVVYLLRTRAWRWMLIPTFIGVVGYFAGWYSEFFHRSADFAGPWGWNGASTETALFAAVFFAIFALPTLKGWSSLPEPDQKTAAALLPVLLPFADAAFLALALYSVFEDSGLHSWLAFLMVGLAAVFLGMMRLQRAAIAGAMYLATGVICLTVAVPLKAHGHSLTTAWLVEGLILYWAGTRFDKESKAPATVLWILSLGGYLLGLGSLVMHWGLGILFDRRVDFFNSNLAAALVAVATLGGAVWLAHKREDTGVQAMGFVAIDGVAVLLAGRQFASWGSSLHPAFANADFATALLGLGVLAASCYAAYSLSRGRSPIAAGTFVLANLVAIFIFVREIGALFTSTEADLQRSLAISGFLMAYGAALLAIGFVKRSAFVRWQALVLLIFTVGKVFLYDISGLSAGYRVASFMGLGAVLMGVSYAYQKDWLGLKAAPAAPADEVRP